MSKPKVVITGLGTVNPVGLTVNETWNNLKSGKNGIGPITLFDSMNFDSRIAGEVKGFDPSLFMDRKEIRRTNRFLHFAIAAAKEAMEDSDLLLKELDPYRFGVILGSGIGGIETMEEWHPQLCQKGPQRITPFFVPLMISNTAGAKVSMMFGAKGPGYTTVSACASSSHAIGEAMKIIQRGDADVMITGGSEATITPMTVAGFCAMKALSTRNGDPETASRPFDMKRDGFVIGEGAAIMVIESLEFASRRGASIYAEISGYGASSDAYHITAPHPEGAGSVRALKNALRDADISPEHIDYINAHGTSTVLNDKIETRVIKEVFGAHARKMVINSTKSMTGHLLGAAGALEVIAVVQALSHSVIHPTINLSHPDPECDLNYNPHSYKTMNVEYACSNSLGFGGHNVSIVLKKHA
jgi:3-oxoacyl-[acyl-carrier-protein] synthase II